MKVLLAWSMVFLAWCVSTAHAQERVEGRVISVSGDAATIVPGQGIRRRGETAFRRPQTIAFRPDRNGTIVACGEGSPAQQNNNDGCQGRLALRHGWRPRRR